MRYLKCTGVALAFDLTIGALSEYKRNAFFQGLSISFIFTTVPAIGPNFIDRLVHQNLFDNKFLQYGLTALEGCGLYVAICQLMLEQNSESSLGAPQIFDAFIILQFFAFKYILDSADEQPELSNSDDASIQSQDNPIEDLFLSEVL